MARHLVPLPADLQREIADSRQRLSAAKAEIARLRAELAKHQTKGEGREKK